MGLMAHARKRLDVWWWRVRFFWLDTREGEYARWTLCLLGAVIGVAKLAQAMIVSNTPLPAGTPHRAIYWWVVQLIIMIIAAAVSMAMRPKVQPPAASEAKSPTVNDGQAVHHHFGECWIEDEFLLAWKVVGTVKIQTGGGKK
jgi:hypothetical protein